MRNRNHRAVSGNSRTSKRWGSMGMALSVFIPDKIKLKMKSSEIKTIIFSRSWWVAISMLECTEDRAAAYQAILDYAFAGKQEWNGLPKQVVLILEMAKPLIDRNIETFFRGMEKGR